MGKLRVVFMVFCFALFGNRMVLASSIDGLLPAKLNVVRQLNDPAYDGVLLLLDALDTLAGPLQQLRAPVEDYLKIDEGALGGKGVSVFSVPTTVIPSGRLILRSIGSISRDYDDVRSFSDAAESGLKKAVGAGVKKLLLVCPTYSRYPTAQLVALLGVLQAVYVPIELRELPGNDWRKLEVLGVWSSIGQYEHERLVDVATAIEAGRAVARDIGGSDPERMSPTRTAEYVLAAFPAGSSGVKVQVIDDQDKIKKDYPLAAAVNRAANVVPRHQTRIIKLEYQGQGQVEQTLLFVGKGVTLDTGGLDVKTSGGMVSMSRDKSGAAAVAGFFKVLDDLKPKGIKAIGIMSMVRNSIGPESYSTDEILTARSGRRIRVLNTDAEGRMAMLDPLCELRELAVNETNPFLFTVATLTGHAAMAVGPGYSIAVDNGPAHKTKEASKLREVSERIGDMIEDSRIRREDYENYRGQSIYEDLSQSGSGRARGYQGATAFLIMGSGLDEHGLDSKTPLKYTHIDMAGAIGPPFPSVPWGSPVAALAARFVVPRV